MSKLEEMIQKLCPDGVKRKSLWEVTIWDKKFNAVDRSKQPIVITYPYLLAAKLFSIEKETGNVFLLSTGEQTGWTNEELAGDNLCEGEVVTIPWGKSRPVKDVIKYYKGKFVTADNRIATSADTTILLNKYLYYWLLSQSEVIDSFYRGSGIKHPSMKDVLDMPIPLPPLPVQHEIVRILDNFTELTAELTAELTVRKKQYEYYRDLMLMFDHNVPKVVLNTLCNIGDGLHGTPQYNDMGTYAFINGNNLNRGKIVFDGRTKYVADHEYNRHRIVFNDRTILMSINGTIGNLAIYNDEKIVLGKSAAYFKIVSDDLNIRFLYYILQTSYAKKYFSDNITGSTIKNLGLNALRRFNIPLPPLSEQKRIVSILDRFDALCNDLSSGLPAEIETRRKQYEYYRDKLLTFKEVKA